MQVHPSRLAKVPASRPRASDLDEDRRDSSRRDDGRRGDDQDRYERRDEYSSSDRRRASPAYENYDQVQRRREEREREEYERIAAERDRDSRRRTPEAELRGNGNGWQRGPPQGPQGGQQGQQGGQGGNWLEQRDAERKASTISIWPPSPKRDRSPSPDRHGKHKSSSSRHHRKKHYSSTDESDSEDDRRKSSKRHRSSKHRSSRKHRDDSDDERRSSKKKRERNDGDDGVRARVERSESRRKSQSPDDRQLVTTRRADSDEGEWVEQEAAPAGDDSDDEIGPMPLISRDGKGRHGDYGGALRPGEGSAMAAYVADGARIPRRGEIGLESTEIERYESIGYVMSGSRHRRMNAVRVRKENQVISAEEKRGILKLQAEEKAKRENQIVAGFKELVETNLQGGSKH